MKSKKQSLLNLMKQALEVDIDRLPNIIFMRHLKNQLKEQTGWLRDNMSNTINAVLTSINVDFSAFGLKCNKEDDEYLLELATLVAKYVWKMYDTIPADLGWNIFISRIKKFNLSII